MGHIRRAKSGRGWSAHYRDLQRRERMRTFATKREAERFLAAQEADLQRGDWRDPELGRQNFKQWSDDWLATTINLKRQSRVGYEAVLKNQRNRFDETLAGFFLRTTLPIRAGDLRGVRDVPVIVLICSKMISNDAQ